MDFTPPFSFSCTSERQLFPQSCYLLSVRQLGLSSSLSLIFLGGCPELHFPIMPLKGTGQSRDATSPKCRFSFFCPARRLLLHNCTTLLTHGLWCLSPLAPHSRCLAGRSPAVRAVSRSYHTGQNTSPGFLDHLSNSTQSLIRSISSSKALPVPPSSVSPTNSERASLHHHPLTKTRADRR